MMYGTIARLRIQPGAEAAIQALEAEVAAQEIPGFIGQYLYRMDQAPDEYYLVVLFESKETYRANAGSAAQAARYARYRALLTADPEWHDGEVIVAPARPPAAVGS